MAVQRKLENLIYILDDLQSELARMDAKLSAELGRSDPQEEESLQAARGAFAKASATVLRARKNTASFRVRAMTLSEGVLTDTVLDSLVDSWVETAKSSVNQTWGLLWQAASLLPVEKSHLAIGLLGSHLRARD